MMAVKTRSEILSDADSHLPDNTSQQITPADVRNRIKDLTESAAFATELSDHASNTSNPHAVTADQVGAATPGKAIALAMIFGG